MDISICGDSCKIMIIRVMTTKSIEKSIGNL